MHKKYRKKLILQHLKKFHIPAYFYAVAAMLFWGMSFVWTSILLRYYQPVTIIFIRLILSAALLFLIIHFFGEKEKILKKDYPLILLSALFNPFLYFLGENYGLKFSTPVISSAIIATIPVFSPVVAYLTLKEKLTVLNISGILVSFFGVLVMLITPDLTLSADIRGIVFLSAAVLSALFYSVLLRKLTFRYSALKLIACQNLIGIFLFLPLFFMFEWKDFVTVKINSSIVYSFILLAVFASSVSFVFFAHSVKLLGVSKANIFSNLIPVFTATFSYLILSETLTLQKAAGIILVIGGVYLSERNKKKTG